LLQLAPGIVFLNYSAMILNFHGGILWGKARELDTSGMSAALLLLSNVLALMA
jgi:hypothetical protein